MKKEDYFADAKSRFGEDMMGWKFVCPVCKYVQTPADYKKAGAPESAVGFSCVGRWIEGSREAFEGAGKGPCNYAGGGLFRMNPIEIEGEDNRYFSLAEQG